MACSCVGKRVEWEGWGGAGSGYLRSEYIIGLWAQKLFCARGMVTIRAYYKRNFPVDDSSNFLARLAVFAFMQIQRQKIATWKSSGTAWARAEGIRVISVPIFSG